MVRLVELVAPRQCLSLQGRGAAPLQLVHHKTQVYLERQHQLLQRVGAGCGPLVVDTQLGHVQGVELQAPIEQMHRLPLNVDLTCLHRQTAVFPAQRTDMPALAQGAPYVLRHQRVPGGQVAAGLVECAGERLVGAAPEPHQQQHGSQRDQWQLDQPEQEQQDAAHADG